MTSNDVSQLPPELTRSGRVDAMWYFSLPTEEERKEIFRIHLNKTGKNISDKLIEVAAANSKNYTGAEIQEITKSAMRKAFKRYLQDNNDTIIEEDIIEAIKETIPLYDSSREKINFLESWVEGRARRANSDAALNEFKVLQDEDLANEISLRI